MGVPSVGILLHEVIKLMYHAKVKDPVFFRIGTCGGIGYEGGTVVISEEAVDGMLKSYMEVVSERIYDLLCEERRERIKFIIHITYIYIKFYYTYIIYI